MRRTCERPGCGQPVAVIYGQEAATPQGLQQFWIDSWSPDLCQAEPPGGTRGVLCAAHGEQLMPPRGWTLVDRRDDVPRLFKPRLVSMTLAPSTSRARRVVGEQRVDGNAPPQRRISDVPRPQLFSDLERDTQTDTQSNLDHLDDPDSVVIVDAERPAGAQPVTVINDEDPEIDEILNASGSLLRDAFQRAHSVKRDATNELLRPTSAPKTKPTPGSPHDQ